MLSGSPRRDELTVKRRLPRGNGNLHALKNEKLPTRISRDTVIPSKRNSQCKVPEAGMCQPCVVNLP